MFVDPHAYDGLTLPQALEAAAAQRPDAALIFHSASRPGVVTVADVARRSRIVAGGLARLGVRRGDAVAVQLPNWTEWALAYAAVTALGAELVPIIPIYGPKEVGFILRESGAKVLVLPDRVGKRNPAERLGEIDGIDDVRLVVVGDEVPAAAVAWSTLESGAPAPPAEGLSPDDRAVLVYTSGTSADPKGVQHSHRSVLADVASLIAWFGPASRPLAAFPFGHIAGVLELTKALLFAERTVVMDAWDPAVAAALVAEHELTSTAGTPFHLVGLLDAADAGGHELSSIREYITGAAAVPPAVLARAEAAGIPAVRVYGCSEHPTISGGHPDDAVDKRTQTDGRAMPGTTIRILTDDGRDAATGEDGEILVRGPEQFLGYRDDALNAGAFHEGWLKTGDVGHLDADGHLTITDRKKDMIIRGGENISSREVEDALMAHPAVVEAAVVALPDEALGERVCAFLRVREGATVDLEVLRDHFHALGMARQKTPERVELVDDFPRTPSGKVKKPLLRERLAASV